MPLLLRTILTVLSIGLIVIGASAHAKKEGSVAGKVPLAYAGYDVTSYYGGGTEAKRGSETYQAVYDGKRYHFVSKESRAAFAKNPQKYIPEFEDYCAFSAAHQVEMKADPSVFTVTNDKVFLFANQEALTEWRKDEAKNYTEAHKFVKYQNRYDASKRLRKDSRVRLLTF